MKDLNAETLPRVPLPEGLQIRHVQTEADLAGLLVEPNMAEAIRLHRRRGKEIFVGAIGREAVSISFVDYEYPAGAMLFADYTLPAFRGRGINPALKRHILAYLKAASVRRAYTSCGRDNASSRRSILHAGFRELVLREKLWVAFMKVIRIFMHEASLMQAEPAEYVLAGESMAPSLKSGWKVTVEPVAIRQIQLGDVAVFASAPLTCHRVVARVRFLGRSYFLHKGDNATVGGVFTGAELVGRVSAAFDEQGRKVELRGNPPELRPIFVYPYILVYLLRRGLGVTRSNRLTRLFNRIYWKITLAFMRNPAPG